MSLQAVIETSKADLNYTESPPYSNRTKFGAEYGMDGQPWCCMALWYWFNHAGEGMAFFGGGKTASCGTLLRWYSAQGQTVAKNDIQPGDIVILNFSGTSETQHCGLVVDTLKMGYIQTIEGNTSQSGSQSNGGQVCLKTRNLSQVVGVCRPIYKEEKPVNLEDSNDFDEHWAAPDIRWVIDKGLMQGYPDGTFKPDKPITRAEMAVILHRLDLIDD